MEKNSLDYNDPKFLKDYYESNLKKELKEIEDIINEDLEESISNFIINAEKENPLIFDTEEKKLFFRDYLRKIHLVFSFIY